MKKGWEVKKLGELCTIKGRIGYRGYTKEDLVSKGEGAISLSPSNILGKDFILDNCTYISWFKYDESPEIKIFNGDIIFVKTGSSYGKSALVEELPEKATINPQLVVFKNINCINKYLYYAVNSVDFKDQVNKIIAGSAIPTLSQANLADLLISVPSKSEQQRIVSVLDEAFASIAQAKSNAERNLVNARELYEAVLQETFTGSKSEKWQTKKLEDVCSLVTDGKHGDSENESNSGYYFLSAKNIKDGTLSYDDAREITKKDFEETHRRTNLMPFDICMVNTGATIGKIALAPDDPKTFRTTFQKSVAIIKPISSIIDNAFCCYHLKSDLEKLLKVSSGSAQKNLLIGDMKNHLVRVPPLAEQRAIVGRLEALSAETGRLEEIYQSKVEALEELKKSVLAKAFEGEI